MPHTFRVALTGAGLVLTLVVGSATAAPRAATTLYVDCAAALGGDGRKQAPFSTITAAVPIAKAVSAEARVIINVATGVCDKEVFPIQLDFPVDVRGSRAPDLDSEGLPLNGQDRDTLVTWTPPSPVPPSVANLPFFRITGSDVRISKLSLDARILPGTVTPAPGATAPIGVLAQGANEFVVDQLRIVRMGLAVRAQGASGRVRDTYVGTVSSGLAMIGGTSAAPPKVTWTNNRIENFWTGALTVTGAGLGGQSIRGVIEGNDTVTGYADTGPSNPYALRINTVIGGSPFLGGTVEASFDGNRFRGSPRYAINVNGGQIVRRADGRRYSGAVDATFTNNLIDPAGITGAVSLITFTNSRATELPCELDPANTPLDCPTLMGNPLQYWEYLQVSVFDLHHGGELDGALIDHPEIEPVDGRILGNVLRLNDAVVDYETFVVAS